MANTARDLIIDALLEIGIGEPGSDLDADDAALALRHLKRMVDAFQADRLLLYTVLRAAYPLVPNQQTRTIGATGDFAGNRPIWIADARVIPVGDTFELPVHKMTRAEWFAEPLKTLTDLYPMKVFYEPTSPNGTLKFWPIPTTAASFIIAVPVPLVTPLTLDTDLAFAPGGYEEAWMLNLAKRCVRAFERATPPAGLDGDAHAALSVVKRLNDEGPPPARSDPALTNGRGGYDIRSNGYR